jgi:hypothetical protein
MAHLPGRTAAVGSLADTHRSMCVRAVRPLRALRGAWLIGTLPAFAQVNTQLWANVTLNWLKSPTLTYELDFEPKVLLTRPEGEPGWNNIDVSPNAEYGWKPWLDMIAEGTIGTTHQTDGIRTFELSPRVGARFHLVSRDVINLGPRHEQITRRRVLVRDPTRDRTEEREVLSSSYSWASSEWRARRTRRGKGQIP